MLQPSFWVGKILNLVLIYDFRIPVYIVDKAIDTIQKINLPEKVRGETNITKVYCVSSVTRARIAL
jgi:hypothetical protein